MNIAFTEISVQQLELIDWDRADQVNACSAYRIDCIDNPELIHGLLAQDLSGSWHLFHPGNLQPHLYDKVLTLRTLGPNAQAAIEETRVLLT